MRLISMSAVFLVTAIGLAGCGKEANKGASAPVDACSAAKASPPFQTYAQAVAECRNRHKMSDESDPKPSNTPITNH